jgi:hypothetical protein
LARVARSVELASDRSGFVRSGVQVEVKVRRIVEHSVNLVSAGMNAASGGVVVSIEMFVVKEINPMPTIVVTRGIVEMEGGHYAVEPLPGDVVTHSLSFCVKIEASNTASIGVSTIFELVTIELH